MPKIVIELREGKLSSIYASPGVDVFINLPRLPDIDGTFGPESFTAEPLDLTPVFREPVAPTKHLHTSLTDAERAGIDAALAEEDKT